ncbi:MAG: carboxypeptidase regulatory-like domain-containing protein [Fulvivirga sp.]
MVKYIAIVLFIAIVGCKNSQTQTLNQGLKGQVLWLEGNFMPGPGQNKKGEPVEREIYIYDVINAKDLQEKGNKLYEMPDQEPIAIAQSNSDGLFEVSLPAGRYSVFTKEEEGLFANAFDGEMNLNPITVEAQKFKEVILKINYKAAY